MFINLLEFKWKRKNGSVTYRRGLELHFVNKSVTGDRGKLKESLINKLQNYYGIAIGSIVGNLAGMNKATLIASCIVPQMRYAHFMTSARHVVHVDASNKRTKSIIRISISMDLAFP